MSVTTLDCSGLACPMPIVKISQAIKTIETGNQLEVIATDPAFETDVHAWARKTGHELQRFEKSEASMTAVITKV